MSKSRHLKRRYMHITIKMLQLKYGSQAPSTLRNHKHTRIETSTTRRWFNHSLSKRFINLLLNNGMISCSHPDIKLLEVTEQGRMRPKLKMVNLNHIKHNLLDVMLLHWSKNLKSIPNWKAADVDDGEAKEVEDSGISGAPTTTDPLSPSLNRAGGDTATSRLLATWKASFPQSKWGILAKDVPLGPGTDSYIGLLCTVKWNPVHGLALPPLLGGKDWDKPTKDWWCTCTRDQLIWP